MNTQRTQRTNSFVKRMAFGKRNRISPMKGVLASGYFAKYIAHSGTKRIRLSRFDPFPINGNRWQLVCHLLAAMKSLNRFNVIQIVSSSNKAGISTLTKSFVYWLFIYRVFGYRDMAVVKEARIPAWCSAAAGISTSRRR